MSRTLKCGCVTCICEDDERCHGCGAKSCFNSDDDCEVKSGRLAEAYALSRLAALEAFAEAVREAGYAAITDEQYSAIIRSALDRLDAAKKEGE